MIKFLKFILKKLHLFNLAKKIKNNFFNKKNKIGVSYSVYDGLELLEASLRSIRESVDYINVVFQEYSYFGKKCDEHAIKFLNHLKNIGLLNEIIIYRNNPQLNSIENERKKRDLGLKFCKKNKCNYFMAMDVDEFYEKDQFNNAIRHITKNNIDFSVCLFYCYLKSPVYRLSEPRKSMMCPFIAKINRFSRIRPNADNLLCRIEQTRVIRLKKESKNLFFYSY